MELSISLHVNLKAVASLVNIPGDSLAMAAGPVHAIFRFAALPKVLYSVVEPVAIYVVYDLRQVSVVVKNINRCALYIRPSTRTLT